jgi:hypothetical protein
MHEAASGPRPMGHEASDGASLPPPARALLNRLPERQHGEGQELRGGKGGRRMHEAAIGPRQTTEAQAVVIHANARNRNLRDLGSEIRSRTAHSITP